MATLYFVDGYHGGIRGHMPEGSWYDILQAMSAWPDWKISLEIEPDSWEYLKQHDLYIYRKLQKFVSKNETAKRVEFIGGSYAQPFCWAVNGESNIRQLLVGIDLIKKHFPTVIVDTYAVQEPCFTSALPQILRQLGYQRASLKNPTAWGGYVDKMPGEMISLISADGSSIPAVPRYECEELVSCSATEGAGYDYSAISQFAEKCIQRGIEAPVGMCLQDLGWASAPLVQGSEVEYVTWREYFERFGCKEQIRIRFSQEDIHVALPWGNRILGDMLRHVRNAENYILQTEKMLAIAWMCAPQYREELTESKKMLDAAWRMLMQAQHHDGYICATCGEGTRQWGFRSNKLALDACALMEHIIAKTQDVITKIEKTDEKNGKSEIWLRVTNTVNGRKKELAEVSLGLEPGAHSLRVWDSQGNQVPCQYQIMRSYADQSIGAAKLFFETQNDGIGYQNYRVELCKEIEILPIKIAKKTIQDIIEVKTDYLHIMFDILKGGSIVRFVDLETGRDYAAGIKGMGTLRGFSIKLNRFISTADVAVKGEILENGPLHCKLSFSGSFEGIDFVNIVTIQNHTKVIRMETKLYFKEKTDIGFPYVADESMRYLGTKRSSCREDYKLGVQIPLGNEKVEITKSAPFDIYQSKLDDTRFDSWEDIKHNIINGYIDFYQPSSDTGMAIYCDAINGYSLVDNQFALTAAFGYHSNFWWGYQPAEGCYTIGYAMMPHQGNWEAGKVHLADAQIRESLMVQRLMEKPETGGKTLIGSDDISVEFVTALIQGEGVLWRLFHAGKDSCDLKLYGELAGRVAAATDLYGNDTSKAIDTIEGFEIKTLRCR